MLIQEKLKQPNQTLVEQKIAEYFLDHPDFIKLSSREIAKTLYVSPSTLIRFCQKMGYEGLNEFKKAYQDELNYHSLVSTAIDPNYPFNSMDNLQKTNNILETLYHDYIKQTHDLIRHDDLQKAIQLLNQASIIYIYSSGIQLDLAQSFKDKILKLGKLCIMDDKVDQLFYQASYLDPKTTCFIIISYSGETEITLKLAHKINKEQIPILAITSYGSNTLTSLSTIKLSLASHESLIYNEGHFGINISLLYLLDLLYIQLFNQNCENNIHKRIELTQEFQTKRHSTNSFLQKNNVPQK